MTISITKSECINVDKGMLEQIDRIQLSERLRREREQFFKREMEITPERGLLAMESWQETGADVLDVRWAKLYQKWTERIPIAIFRGQLVLGSDTKLFRGAEPWVEYETPNMLEVMEKGRQMRTSAARTSTCSEEDWEALTETLNFFSGKSPVDVIFKSMASLYGDWPEEFEKARGIRRQGKANHTPPVAMWDKLLSKGLRAVIEEAEAGIEKVRSGEEPDAKKAWFWRAVVIVCGAGIHYAHRFARLARDLAEGERDPARRRELEQAAEICERVPEYPARTLREAIQSRVMWGIILRWGRPDALADESGRADQYLYPYFISDIRESRLTLGEASDLIGTLLSNVSRHDGVKNLGRGEYQQGATVNNLTLGGLTKDGQDANNELTYLILHTVGLIKYAEPHYTFRVNAGTPRWALLKALETNRKVGGGQPQFMSDDRTISYLVRQGEALEDARDWSGHG